MATRPSIVPARDAHRGDDLSSYGSYWVAVALLCCAALMGAAVLQSAPLPLSGLVAGLGLVGGVIFVRAPRGTPRALQQYVGGAFALAAATLVAVGVGHHFLIGLTALVLLAGSSPWTLRWIAGVGTR